MVLKIKLEQSESLVISEDGNYYPVKERNYETKHKKMENQFNFFL